MDTLSSARALMGASLAFHILYTAVGIGLPLLLLIAEGLSLRTGDELYRTIARRWARTAGVLFAIGAVSGTILSFELGLLWPEFMRYAGGIIGMPFSLEGFAFFVEAIFLGLYLYGPRRLSRRMQFLVTIPIVISAALSAVFVISANAWMNTPRGFRVVDGLIVDVQPYRAMFNPAMPYEALHGTLASYVATGFAAAGVYAFALLRGHATAYNRRALALALAVGGAALPLMFVSGDLSARFVAENQPEKFAAMEGIFETTAGAPLHIGGWPDMATGEMQYSIEIPKLLSLLGYGDPHAVVTGLNDFPAGTTPDVRLVHPFFDLMVGSFFVMLLAAGWYWFVRLRQWWSKRRGTGAEPRPEGVGEPYGFPNSKGSNRWLLRALLVASPFGFIALESGWMVTEFGRQPWVIYRVLLVAEGVTTRDGVVWVFLLFMLVYLALTIGLLWLLLVPRRVRPRSPGGEAGDALR